MTQKSSNVPELENIPDNNDDTASLKDIDDDIELLSNSNISNGDKKSINDLPLSGLFKYGDLPLTCDTNIVTAHKYWGGKVSGSVCKLCFYSHNLIF